jgi:hypothetical protein
VNPKFTARLVVEPSKPANEHGHPTPRRLAPEPAQSLSSTPSHGLTAWRGWRCWWRRWWWVLTHTAVGAVVTQCTNAKLSSGTAVIAVAV